MMRTGLLIVNLTMRGSLCENQSISFRGVVDVEAEDPYVDFRKLYVEAGCLCGRAFKDVCRSWKLE